MTSSSTVWSLIQKYPEFYKWLIEKYSQQDDVDLLDLIKMVQSNPSRVNREVSDDTRKYLEKLLRADFFEYLTSQV